MRWSGLPHRLGLPRPPGLLPRPPGLLLRPPGRLPRAAPAWAAAAPAGAAAPGLQFLIESDVLASSPSPCAESAAHFCGRHAHVPSSSPPPCAESRGAARFCGRHTHVSAAYPPLRAESKVLICGRHTQVSAPCPPSLAKTHSALCGRHAHVSAPPTAYTRVIARVARWTRFSPRPLGEPLLHAVPLVQCSCIRFALQPAISTS